jgi:tetratricopeptide (TPR) repeat protein
MSKNFIASGAFPPKGTIHVIKVDDVPLIAIVKRENFSSSDGYRYFEKMQFDSAEVCFRKAAEADPKSEEFARMLAASLIYKGRYAESQEFLNKALAIYPENYIAIYLKGLIMLNQNKPDSAMAFFDQATSLKVNYADPYYAKGKACMMKRDFQLAIQQFELAYKHGGQNYKILNEAALAYLMLGDAVPDTRKNNYEKGINLLNESLQKNANQADVYQNLGYAYSRLGNQQAADQCYQRMNQLRR